MSWQERPLGSGMRVKHGFAFKSQFFYDKGKFVVLTPGNFYEKGGFRLRPGKDRFYIADIPNGFVLQEGDLIVAMTEQGPGLLGSSAIIPEDDKFLHNQRLGLIQELDESVFNRRFLYYLFNTHAVRGQIRGSASGTKVRHTSPERIYQVRVTVPDVGTQRKIATILSAYDDLIENNRRRIALLEQAARLLYREWFVRFRFPGHEHVKIIDGVPEGWDVVTIEDIAEIRNGFAFKSEDYSQDGTPLVRTRDFSATRFVNRNEDIRIPDSLIDKYSKYQLNRFDFLLIMVGASLGRFGIVTRKDLPALQNQNMWAIYTKNEKAMPQTYLIEMMKGVVNQVIAFRVGAAREFFRKGFLEKQQIVRPSSALLNAFSGYAKPIYSNIEILLEMNESLIKVRNLLLPRLMSGEIVV
jgi:type I restriction enzyme, S subunit